MYKSVGTIRCEVVNKESTFLFVPDSDHCVQHVSDQKECAKACGAAFLKADGSWIVKLLKRGGVELTIGDGCKDAVLLAAARQVKVEVTVCKKDKLELTCMKERAW